jgi:eukaryotic-like serine/threonine-protein kinase
MRLLFIDDDLQRTAQLKSLLISNWPNAECRVRSPSREGLPAPEFLAQGYDAVLLPERWPGGEGMSWLRELTARRGFAPIIFLTHGSDARQRTNIASWGVAGIVATNPLESVPLCAAVAAASKRQHEALADWRVSGEAAEARRFGDAHIPGYRKARVLARGSVSQLYLAESEKAGDMVVLKVTPSTRNESGIDQSFDRFLQEYEISERLQHPNVVRLFELGVADDHAYLAMEYFPRGDLRQRLRSGLATSEALAFAAQLARVLAAVHGAGILHRDLKPGNIMLRTSEQLALIDFGLAKQLAMDLDLTDRGLIYGTPHYMSPEQGHGQPMDHRSDLYSLGVLLFEMLSGHKPYTADNPMAVLYMHRRHALPELPAALCDLQPLIERLMAKLPEDRYQDAAAAAEAIEAVREAWLARLVAA